MKASREHSVQQTHFGVKLYTSLPLSFLLTILCRLSSWVIKTDADIAEAANSIQWLKERQTAVCCVAHVDFFRLTSTETCIHIHKALHIKHAKNRISLENVRKDSFDNKLG